MHRTGTPPIAALARQPLDPVLVYRLVTADGRRGAHRRVALQLGVSRERIRQIVKRHETLHPVLVGKNTPAARPVAPEAAQRVTAHAGDSLAYIPPPLAYRQPEPRIVDCAIVRDPLLDMLIMSNVPLQVAPRVQVFERAIVVPQGSLPVANAKRAAEAWLLLCFGMTLVSVAVGSEVLGLGLILLVVSLAMWAVRV